MARMRRLNPVDIPQHVIQRGNNRQACFTGDKDMAAYAHWLKLGAEKFGVEIHAWVFMTNHVHLLATPREQAAISKMMQYLGRVYVRYFNQAYQRTGTLWEGRFKSCIVQEETYFLGCQRYIELNPVRAGMVLEPEDYTWSSYRTNAYGVRSSIVTAHAVYMGLGGTTEERLSCYRSLFENQINRTKIEDIRTSLNQGLVLGDQRFKDQIQAITGQRTQLRKPGRKNNV